MPGLHARARGIHGADAPGHSWRRQPGLHLLASERYAPDHGAGVVLGNLAVEEPAAVGAWHSAAVREEAVDSLLHAAQHLELGHAWLSLGTAVHFRRRGVPESQEIQRHDGEEDP
jgi:hypothetical protein